MTLQAALPFAGRTVISLDPAHYEVLRRTVAAAFRLAHGERWQALVDAAAPAHLRFAPGNFGVFMGYDFHLTPAGPRLIEINTNAGGALVNGLHTAALCDPARLACLCADLLPVETMEERLVAQFVAEYEAVRGAGARPRRMAIADEKPEQQFLRAEFELMRALFERHGIEAHICDTAELSGKTAGSCWPARRSTRVPARHRLHARDAAHGGAAGGVPRARRRGDARAARVLPARRQAAPRAARSPAALAGAGATAEEAALFAEVVPETRLLAELDPEQVWRERSGWVFKPATAFGSRAVYRGDKISRRRFDEVLAVPGYLAQRRAPPGEIDVETSDGPQR